MVVGAKVVVVAASVVVVAVVVVVVVALQAFSPQFGILNGIKKRWI